jgi:hypothetical protein
MILAIGMGQSLSMKSGSIRKRRPSMNLLLSLARRLLLWKSMACGHIIPEEREQPEWDLYYVLLIKRKDEKWERIGLGEVFRRAFRKAKVEGDYAWVDG